MTREAPSPLPWPRRHPRAARCFFPRVATRSARSPSPTSPRSSAFPASRVLCFARGPPSSRRGMPAPCDSRVSPSTAAGFLSIHPRPASSTSRMSPTLRSTTVTSSKAAEPARVCAPVAVVWRTRASSRSPPSAFFSTSRAACGQAATWCPTAATPASSSHATRKARTGRSSRRTASATSAPIPVAPGSTATGSTSTRRTA